MDVMLKERYQEQLGVIKKLNEELEDSKVPCGGKDHVDHRNDTFLDVIYVRRFDHRIASVPGSMAEYVLWLEHQYTRYEGSGVTAAERESWYKKRIAWFKELMQAMEVDIETLTKDVKYKIETTSWEHKDEPDGERIVIHILSHAHVYNDTQDLPDLAASDEFSDLYTR
ncbi:hypothetical protein BDV06DRAFT_222651 [Aspergillus oleicola]